MRKAKTLYVSRYQEYDKIREQAMKAENELSVQSTVGNSGTLKSDAKAEKRKKQEDEALQKVGKRRQDSSCMTN
jgi:hypothetical protein